MAKENELVEDRADLKLRVSCSALLGEGTGIGVLQRKLYPLLAERGLELSFSAQPAVRRGILPQGRRLVDSLFKPIEAGHQYLSLVSPLPLNAPRQTVAVIHDLRWMRTRNGLARAYRSWDLKRTVRRTAHLICISQKTREELISFMPESESKASVAWLGPGIIPADQFRPTPDGTTLLIGGAPHKRNELAATALAAARPAWLRNVVGVGVSTEVRAVLESALGPERCTWHDRISDEELGELYQSAAYFILFSVEEGFGMPYIEALASGCEVIAIDQALTREILGKAGHLIHDGTVDGLASQLNQIGSIDVEVRRMRAERFAWSRFADSVATAIRSLH